MSARISFSENTAAKRIVGLACATAWKLSGKAVEAASAAPALSAARRLIRESIGSPPGWTRLSELVHHPERPHADGLPVHVGGRGEGLGQPRRAGRAESGVGIVRDRISQAVD